jgi:anti-anti-sigma factor
VNVFEGSLRREGAAAVIDLSGLLDRSAEAIFGEVFERALSGEGDPIVLNFGAVDYINSTGIALVVGALARARAVGRPVRAFGLSDHYREIFTITRLVDFMGIFEDEAAAVGGTAT